MNGDEKAIKFVEKYVKDHDRYDPDREHYMTGFFKTVIGLAKKEASRNIVTQDLK